MNFKCGTADAKNYLAGSYNFTYTVSIAGCTDDTETLTVTVGTLPNAGVATSQSTCSTVTNFDLFVGLSGNDIGGAWNDDDASGALTSNIFDASAVADGVYNFTYTVSVAGCADSGLPAQRHDLGRASGGDVARHSGWPARYFLLHGLRLGRHVHSPACWL